MSPESGPPGDEVASRSSLSQGLRSKILSGIAWLALGRAVAQVLTLATRVVLARLLAPEAFGAVAIAGAVAVVIDLIVGMGTGVAVVQAKVMNDVERSTAFWMSTGRGLVLILLSLMFAPVAVWFFGASEISTIILVMVAGAALAAPANVFEALFAREMEFSKIAIRRIASSVMGSIVALSFAFNGFGVWSLVAQRLAADAALYLMTWLISPWKPSLAFSWAAARSQSRIGLGATVSTALTVIGRQAPIVIIGRWLGVEQVGYYSLAQQALTAPLLYVYESAGRVIFSLLSRLQGSPREFIAMFENAQRKLVVAATPIPVLVALLAPVGVPFVFGEQWAPAIVPLQLSAIPTTLSLIAIVPGAAVNASGRARLLVVVTLVPLVLGVTGLCIGISHGLSGAVAGRGLGMVLGLGYVLALLATILQSRVLTQFRVLLVAVPPALALSGGGYAVLWLSQPLPTLVRLALAAVVGMVAYIAAVRAVAPAEWHWFAARAIEAMRRGRRRA